MQRFPRLTAVFGVPVDALDTNAIQSAIARGIREDFDLDWKEAHYPRNKNRDMAKDVAQLANTFGGIIVLGVKERNGRADASTPVALGDDQERRVREVVTERIRPFLPGITFRSIETSPGAGYLIIVVPQSADAPHAVLEDNKALSYLVRDGTKSRWLSEYEVAGKYRDRFHSREGVTERLDAVHAQGLSRLKLYRYPWLAVSLVPLIGGHRGAGSEILAAERDFVKSKWPMHAFPGSPFSGEVVTVWPGVRRVVVTEDITPTSAAVYPLSELHRDGSGFGATWRLFEPASDNSFDAAANALADKIRQDAMEIQILGLILLLAHHAVDTGARGECILRAQQLLVQQTDPRHTIGPGQMTEPTSFTGRPQLTEYRVVDSSLTVTTQTQPADASGFLDELTTDIRAAVKTGYGLAADILGEFGVSEPIFLRSDGLLNVHNVLFQRRQNIESWAQQNDLTAPPNV
jgi:hypothetical protein